MLKKINRVLKLVGLNLVRAKRKSVKWQKIPPADPTTCAAVAVPLSDYMGDSEWHNAPGPEGPTGSVGCCGVAGPLGPTDGEGVRGPSGPGFRNAKEENLSRVPQPNSDNKTTGPTS